MGDPATSLLRKLRQEVMNLKAALSSFKYFHKENKTKKSALSFSVIMDNEYTFPRLHCP